MTRLQATNKSNGRPVVYDYGSPVEFLVDLLDHYKSSGSFSLRQRTAKVGSCSQALVSQILKGNRQLNRDNLPAIASIFKLTQAENLFIDRKLSAHIHKIDFADVSDEPKSKRIRQPKNHLLTDWLNPYVKDLINLRGFRLDPQVMFSMLKGIAPAQKIKKSVEFLLREGFWRITPSGEVVPEEAAVITTNEVPNEKIRAFHKRALEIAMRALTTLPTEKRKAATVLISVNREHFDDLKNLVDSFQHQLLDFIERHPNGRDSLVQVAIHLTPIGDHHE